MMQSNSQPVDLSVGLMIFPLRNPDEEYQGLILQLVSLLAPLVKRMLIITGNFHTNLSCNNVGVINVRTPIIRVAKESVVSKAFRLVLAQFTLSKALIQQSKRVDIIMLYFSAGLLFLPVLCARILGKKVVVITTGSASQSLRAMYPDLLGRRYSTIVRGIEHFNYRLADKIVVYSRSMIEALGIEKYRDKIIFDGSDSPYIACNAYVDTEQFAMKPRLSDRESLVGYVGRLSGEKGVMELAAAIPLILTAKPEVRFLIVGVGPLMSGMRRKIEESRCSDKVRFAGWKPHQELSDLLNEMKFIIIPSHTEVVAAVALEAMACGSICIANPVGATKDVIVDTVTGFLLKDNQPSTIADRVIEVWSHPELSEIQKNARAFVNANFTYEKVQERWGVILRSLYS